MGYLNNSWSDQAIADLLTGNVARGWEGAGVNSLRPALYEDFIEKYGREIRVDAFKHYKQQGACDNVVFISDRPSEEHREKKEYVAGKSSQSYENLYEPIWDDGSDGTLINEKNYYAAYVYKVVETYKDYIKFWEIKNEPDFTYTGNGDRASGNAGNWWDNDPNPGDLKNWNAPIQSYVRLLRVSYEVIKHLDKDAFVCIGGVGYESFLDAVLRNTDNPNGGTVTEEYPYQGGAWFDCLSFHIYPMYYLRTWNSGFQYFRHTDAAVKAVVDRTTNFRNRLKAYNYGTEYPEKEIIITETNIPSTQAGDNIGSLQAQCNFLIKTAIKTQQIGVAGVYPYCIWDGSETSVSSYDCMGFYKLIPETPQNAVLRIKESGIGWRTTSRLLSKRKYNEGETSRLSLPTETDGGAFHSTTTNDYIYVLWAKTTKDQSESASHVYRFPDNMQVKKLTVTSWDEKKTSITGNTITLTGDPVFIKVE